MSKRNIIFVLKNITLFLSARQQFNIPHTPSEVEIIDFKILKVGFLPAIIEQINHGIEFVLFLIQMLYHD